MSHPVQTVWGEPGSGKASVWFVQEGDTAPTAHRACVTGPPLMMLPPSPPEDLHGHPLQQVKYQVWTRVEDEDWGC